MRRGEFFLLCWGDFSLTEDIPFSHGGYYLVLPKYGVIPFEIRTLKKGHTEKWRAQRFYIAEIVRHRGTVGAWRNRGYFRVLLMLLSTSLQSSSLQDFLKCLLPKLSATRTLRLCRSLCLRHLRDFVCFHLRALPLSVCLLYVVGLLYHSKLLKTLLFSLTELTDLTELFHPRFEPTR